MRNKRGTLRKEREGHYPVLLKETIDLLAPQPGDVALDATAGEGGHAYAVCQAIGDTGTMIVTDLDERALGVAKEKLAGCEARKFFVQANFRTLRSVLEKVGIESVDVIIADLGLSQFSIDGSGRGFSFSGSEPLSMTFASNPEEGSLTASEIVNTWEEEHLADIIYGFGGERHSRKIARGIVEAREDQKFSTTDQLVDVIEKAVPPSYLRGRLHPATKTFQALRMTVNDELGALEQLLVDGFEALSPGGRMAIISFHEHEDRLVKRFFKYQQGEGHTLLTKKVVMPTQEEVSENRASRSAKLRVIQKS